MLYRLTSTVHSKIILIRSGMDVRPKKYFVKYLLEFPYTHSDQIKKYILLSKYNISDCASH